MRFLFSRFRKDQKGTAAIEFGMLVIPFIAVTMSLFEVTTMFMADQSFDSAVQEAAREIRTGEVHKAGVSKEEFANKICANFVSFNRCHDNLIINVKSYPSFDAAVTGGETTLQAAAAGTLDPNVTAYDVGAGSDVVLVQAFMNMPLIVLANIGLQLADNGPTSKLLVSTVAIKNEPFASTSTAQNQP